MRILYIGDVMGRTGREAVAKVLPKLKVEEEIDFVAAQAENVSHGKSILPNHMEELHGYGVDFFTGGNHTFERPQILSALSNPDSPVIGPANMLGEYPATGVKIWQVSAGRVLVVSLLGSVFPNPFEIENPLKKIDEILAQSKEYDAAVVNFHGDFSSEKMMMGHYLDGRVDLVVGDHWHVPTADARTLPKGTGYVTDVGMCGSLESSLGIDYSVTIPRWRDGEKTKQLMSEARPWQFNAVLFDTDSREIKSIRSIIK